MKITSCQTYLVDGHCVLPDRPGFGFDLDEEELNRHPGLRTRPADRVFYV